MSQPGRFIQVAQPIEVRNDLAIDLREIAAQVVGDASILAEHKQIDPGLESVQTVPLLVIGERAAMIVLLANLIDNAIRYTHRGGKIDVLIGQQDN